MSRIPIILILCMAFMSCNTEKRKDLDLCSFQIDNPELERAIIEYQSKLYKENSERISNGDSIYACVSSKDINDSIYRFVISPLVSISDMKFELPFYICKVNGHSVFFTANSVHPNYFLKPPLFSMSDESFVLLAKTFFPNEVDNSKEKDQKVYLYETTNLYLTFKYDSLIGKKYQRGAWIDTVPVNLDGCEVNM